MNKQLKLTAIALVALTVPMLSASAGEKPFPKIIPVLEGAPPEGSPLAREPLPTTAQSMDQSTR